jgi:DNA-binding winged helix-turn-helix (wHTH) protein
MKHFSPLRLDLATGLLYRGRERVSLSRKSAAVLAYLVARAGQVVSKQELLAAVWPDTHVIAENLKVHVLEIRKALKDSVREPVYIETQHGRGYRFVAPVLDEEPRRASTAVDGRMAFHPVSG